MTISRDHRGFTLIEVILAMAIFGIIAIVFISVFSTSLVWIFTAGDRSEATAEAQTDVEQRLATGDSVETPSLVLNFSKGGTNIPPVTIPGGLVESTQQVGKGQSSLEAFVPLVPTITLNQFSHDEGKSGAVPLTVTLTNAEFLPLTDRSVSFELYTADGQQKIGSTLSVPSGQISSETQLTVSLPANLANGDYVIRIIIDHTDLTKDDEVARARYSVLRPQYVAAAGTTLYVSDAGSTWIQRSGFIGDPRWPAFTAPGGAIRAFATSLTTFVGVGDSGYHITGINRLQWGMGNIPGATDLTDITWSAYFDRFIAVDKNGNVFASQNGASWQNIGPGLASRFGGVASVELTTGAMIAAMGYRDVFTPRVDGSGNLDHDIYLVVARSVTLGVWDVAEFPVTNAPLINALASNDQYIVAATDSGIWRTALLGDSNAPASVYSGSFTDVAHNLNVGFVAVGVSNAVRSLTGASWSVPAGAPSSLNSVSSVGGNAMIAVGNGGAVYRYNGTTWANLSVAEGPSFTAVVGR